MRVNSLIVDWDKKRDVSFYSRSESKNRFKCIETRVSLTSDTRFLSTENLETKAPKLPARTRSPLPSIGKRNIKSMIPDAISVLYAPEITGGSSENNPFPGHRRLPRRSSSMKSARELDWFPKRSSVSFSFYDEVREIAPAKSLTCEPECLWYQPDEILSIQKKNKRLVQKQQSGTRSRQACTRGLESSLSPGERYEKQLKIWESIKDIQNYQKKYAIDDDELISQVYRRCSEEDRKMAAHRAAQDFAEINTERFLKRLSRRRSCDV
mmetsp:Transcript_23826/g.38828  ORF Transcript_23826/g.38828 Transcript_23826/m.38828 type:complete len:267 (+) Transcript_23826:262-1062(+)